MQFYWVLVCCCATFQVGFVAHKLLKGTPESITPYPIQFSLTSLLRPIRSRRIQKYLAETLTSYPTPRKP
jgi:hypothetical protein